MSPQQIVPARASMTGETQSKSDNTIAAPSNRPGLHKSNNSSRRTSSIFIPPKRPRQPTLPVNNPRLPSPEASDRDDMPANKKRRLEHGSAEKVSFKQLMKQLHDHSQVIEDANEKLMAEKTAQTEEIRELKAKLGEFEQTDNNNTTLLRKYKTRLQSLLSDHDVLTQRYDQNVQSTRALEQRHEDVTQQLDSLQAKLDHSSAEHTASQSRLLEDNQRLKRNLKESNAALAELQPVRLSCDKLEHNEKALKGRISELEQDLEDFRSGMETQLAANNAKDAQLDKLQRGAVENDARLLRKANDELRKELICSEKLVAHLRAESHEITLAMESQTQASNKIAKNSAEAIVACKIELSRLQLESKRLELNHAIEKQQSRQELDTCRKQGRQREQLEQVIDIMRDSHDRVSRGLQAALDGSANNLMLAQNKWSKEKEALTQAHEALSLEHSEAQAYANNLRTQLQAVQQKAHRHGIQMGLQAHAQVLQEAESLRGELDMSEARVAQLEARYQQLDWQHKSSEQQHTQYIRDCNKRIEDKNTDLTKCNHTVAQLQIHLAAVVKQNTLYNDHLLQQGGKIGELTSELSEKDLTISHLRKCRIAMRWHVAAIKAQREAASVGNSAAAADLEAHRQEVKRLNVLLETARLARTWAEHSRSVAEAELHEVAGRFDAASAELVTLRRKESLAVKEIDTLKSRNACQTKVLQQHETCAAERKWLDDRYQDAFDQLQELRKQLETSRSRMVDSGTDAIQSSRTVKDTNSPVMKIPITQLLTPTSSMSPPPRLRGKRNSGKTVTTPLRVEIPGASKLLQLPTPTPSTDDIALPRRPHWAVPGTPVQQGQHRAAPPKQPRHFEREDELRHSYQQEWPPGQGTRESRGEELFPYRTGAIPARPPMGSRSWSDMYRRPVDAYRPR